MGEGVWTCTSEFICLSASPTAFFGGNGVGEYQVITGNGTSNDFSMSYTEAKDVFIEAAAIFAEPITPDITFDTGSVIGNCGVASITDSITTSNPNEIIIGLVSWDNTTAFSVNAGWNFRYSQYVSSWRIGKS